MTGVRGTALALAEIGTTLSKDPRSAKFLPTWLLTLCPGHNPLRDGLPWMNFKVIDWMDTYLRPTMEVFEYGAGGSTVFVARRARRLVSVESNPRWFELVSRALREEGLSNCDLTLIPPVRSPAVEGVPYGPRSYTSYAPEVAGYTFEAYVKSIDAHPDKSFDLVIVDGYARPSAVTHAISKVRAGGYLLLDDSDRVYTNPALPVLDGYARTDFLGAAPFQRHLQQASIWRL